MYAKLFSLRENFSQVGSLLIQKKWSFKTVQENWDRISHQLTNQYKGHGYKQSLFKNITYLRAEMTERSETRFILGVPSDLERQLIQRSIANDITQEIQKLIPSQFSTEFEITGMQFTFPAPIIIQEPEIISSLARLPEKIETPKKTIVLTDFSLAETVAGNENRILLKALERTLVAPQEIPFPLLITGASGVGKTHHAKTIATELQKLYQPDRVKLITGERFLTDFLEHIKTKQTWKFHKKYRSEADALIIDDISCLKGAKKTQEEFLAVLDYFHASHKIIVVTLPCLPRDLVGLEPAIVSRLTSGLHIALDLPSLEFRSNFLKSQFQKLNLKIEQDYIELITENATCFRQIKGIINKINFLFAGRTDLISLAEVNSYIKLSPGKTSAQTPEQILNFASERFKIEVAQIISKSRAKDTVTARNYAICMMREKLGLSMQEIGRHVGFRDHSTIRHALMKQAIPKL